MKSRFALIAAAACAAAALGNCRQVAGIDDRHSEECPATQISSFALESCGSCSRANCCSEIAACDADPQCRSDVDCLVGCEDEACRVGCDDEARYTEKTAAVVACLVGSCAEACGLGCGVRQPVAFGCDPASACRDVCCSKARERDADLDYQRIRVCHDACAQSDQICIGRCANGFPLGADRARAVDECMSVSCGPFPPWDCVGEVFWRTAKKTPFDAGLTVQDYVTQKPLPGLTVKGCAITSASCDPPPFGIQQTDEKGHVSISVTPSFRAPGYAGYLDVSGSSEGADYRFLIFFTPPMFTSGEIVLNAPSLQAAETLAELVGVKLDPTRGHVFTELRGCRGAQAPHVSISTDSADEASRTFYVPTGTGIPNVTVTESDGSPTSGIVNLPPGLVEITARANDICTDIGRVKLLVRPGTFSYSRLPPTP